MKVSELTTEMNGKFAEVERSEQFDREFAELREAIRAEGEATRRHFDVVIERIFGEWDRALDSLEKAIGEAIRAFTTVPARRSRRRGRVWSRARAWP